MTIANIIRNCKGRAGSNGAWRIETEITDFGTVCKLFHYSTKMLEWLKESPTNTLWLDYSIGHGSVSDQNGMNKAFNVLGIPLYFSRSGGARIEASNWDDLSLNARRFRNSL